MVEKFGICYVPSASTLRYCQTKNLVRTQPLQYKPDKCVAICAGTRNDYKKFEEDIDLLSPQKYKRIKMFPLPTSESMKPKVIGSLPNMDIVHFACHGLFLGDKNQDPLESGLLTITKIVIIPIINHGFLAKPFLF